MATLPIPVFYDMPFIDKKRLDPQAKIYSDTLSSALQELHALTNSNINSKGILIKNKTTAEISDILPENGTIGIWFNTDTGELQFKTSLGSLHTITHT